MVLRYWKKGVGRSKMEKFISIPWNDDFLYGVFHEEDYISDKMVVFIHGIPGDRVDARRLPVRIARNLLKYHISSIRVDLYASGVSKGEFGSVTLADQKEQIKYIINYVRNNLHYRGKIILVAFSEAAKIANVIARECDDISGICYCNGILVKEEIADSLRVKRLYMRDGMFVANIGFGVWLNSNIISEIDEWSLHNTSELACLDSLFIYGEDDDLTTKSKQFINGIIDNYYRMEVIKGADHLFTNSIFDKEIISTISSWIIETTF